VRQSRTEKRTFIRGVNFIKRAGPLVGLLVFCGCGSYSKLPADRSQNNLNAPTPSPVSESSQPSAEEANAVKLVAAAIESNKLNVTSNDLKAKKNPKGASVFVYVPQTRYSGVERYVIWLVVDSKAYALNSPSKMVTPSLPWSRDADDATWNKTGINKYKAASEAIEIVFGK
jgi:hypothetical protein